MRSRTAVGSVPLLGGRCWGGGRLPSVMFGMRHHYGGALLTAFLAVQRLCACLRACNRHAADMHVLLNSESDRPKSSQPPSFDDTCRTSPTDPCDVLPLQCLCPATALRRCWD